jgi:hypothetical protein
VAWLMTDKGGNLKSKSAKNYTYLLRDALSAEMIEIAST